MTRLHGREPIHACMRVHVYMSAHTAANASKSRFLSSTDGPAGADLLLLSRTLRRRSFEATEAAMSLPPIAWATLRGFSWLNCSTSSTRSSTCVSSVRAAIDRASQMRCSPPLPASQPPPPFVSRRPAQTPSHTRTALILYFCTSSTTTVPVAQIHRKMRSVLPPTNRRELQKLILSLDAESRVYLPVSTRTSKRDRRFQPNSSPSLGQHLKHQQRQPQNTSHAPLPPHQARRP